MATISRTVQWTLLTDDSTIRGVLPAAVKQAKFNVLSLTPSEILVDVPQALLSNQWGSKISGATMPAVGDKTHIEWAIAKRESGE
jgi:hypothetical protein